MLRYFLTITISLVGLWASGQDLIVTRQGDSVQCEITRFTDEFIYFHYLKDGKAVQTLIARSSVVYFKYDYYGDGYALTDNPEGEKQTGRSKDYQAFQLSFGGGLYYRLGKTLPGLPPDLRAFIEGARSGIHLSADARYFFTETFGAGFIYRGGFYSNEGYVTVRDENNVPVKALTTTNVKINFYGPSLVSRLLIPGAQSHFEFGFGIGYGSISDFSTVQSRYVHSTGSNVAFAYHAGYYARIKEKVALGLQLNFIRGRVTTLTINDGFSITRVKLPEDWHESLAQAGGSVQLLISL